MNFTDVLGTWKQIKEYIDTKISSSNDGVPIGAIIAKNADISEEYLGENYAKCDGSNVESDSKYLVDVEITDDTSNSKMPKSNKVSDNIGDSSFLEGKIIDNIYYSRSGIFDLKTGLRILDNPITVYPWEVGDKCIIESNSYNNFTIYELDGKSTLVKISVFAYDSNDYPYNIYGLLRILNRYYCFAVSYSNLNIGKIYVTNDFVNFTYLMDYESTVSMQQYGAMYANDGCIYFLNTNHKLCRINIDGTITTFGSFGGMTNSRGSCLVYNNIFYTVSGYNFIYYYNMSTNESGYYRYSGTGTYPSYDGTLRIVKFNNKEYLCAYDRIYDDEFKVGKGLIWYNGYIYYSYNSSLYKCKDSVKVTPDLSTSKYAMLYYIKIK